MDIQLKQQQVEQELLTVIVNNLKSDQLDVATISSKDLLFLAFKYSRFHTNATTEARKNIK